MKRSTSHRRHSATLILVGALLVATPASATNWIMLQGTETDKTPEYKPFGFVGVDYQKTGGADLAAGPWKGQPLILNQIGPGLESSSELQVSYARVGLRGRLLDGKLNYWVSPLAGWYQDGRREIRTGKEQTEETFGRKRYGLGATFRQGPWRTAGEWIKADGMIFNGTDGAAVPGALSNNGKMIASYNVLPDDKADGWYLDGGYTVFGKWELRARYDRLNRGTDERDTERGFETFTLGLTYRHNKHFRVLADYELRDVDAPGLPGSAPPSQILSELDDRFAIRLWARF